MKILLIGLLIAVTVTFGCSSDANIMSPKIAAVMKEAGLDYPINKVRAYTHWSSGYGHGLDVEVWGARTPKDYARNLDAELDGAAKVFAVLAKSDLSVRWEFLEVRFFNDYGQMPPDSRNVVGVADVLILRDKLSTLREKQAEASEYAQNWILVTGYKDQPDSKELLKW